MAADTGSKHLTEEQLTQVGQKGMFFHTVYVCAAVYCVGRGEGKGEVHMTVAF